ncbi:hypothetical protein NMG60_11017672 [Bertholletia excelsa]
MAEKKTWETLCLVLNKVKPYLAMVSLQLGYAGLYITAMVSLKRGMSHYTFVVYRHAAATLFIAPFALVLERKTRPKMTISIFLKIMALALLEPVIDQNLYYAGMKLTSASFASATSNAVPALTFILAIIFRLERVNLKQKHGVAKVIGTAITITGAMVMTLYKGPIVDFMPNSHASDHHQANSSSSNQQHWVIGTILLLACFSGWSGFFILQSITLKQYPAELSLTALVCLMGMVGGSVLAFIMERDMKAWVVRFDCGLLAAVYAGVVCSGIAYYVQGVVNRARGPVFVTVFNPLCMIITAVLGAIVLAEKIHLGSLIGATIIVLGLYTVVWGKSIDRSSSEVVTRSEEDDKDEELPVVNNGAAGKPKISSNRALPQDP